MIAQPSGGHAEKAGVVTAVVLRLALQVGGRKRWLPSGMLPGLFALQAAAETAATAASDQQGQPLLQERWPVPQLSNMQDMVLVGTVGLGYSMRIWCNECMPRLCAYEVEEGCHLALHKVAYPWGPLPVQLPIALALSSVHAHLWT